MLDRGPSSRRTRRCSGSLARRRELVVAHLARQHRLARAHHRAHHQLVVEARRRYARELFDQDLPRRIDVRETDAADDAVGLERIGEAVVGERCGPRGGSAHGKARQLRERLGRDRASPTALSPPPTGRGAATSRRLRSVISSSARRRRSCSAGEPGLERLARGVELVLDAQPLDGERDVPGDRGGEADLAGLEAVRRAVIEHELAEQATRVLERDERQRSDALADEKIAVPCEVAARRSRPRSVRARHRADRRGHGEWPSTARRYSSERPAQATNRITPSWSSRSTAARSTSSASRSVRSAR